MTQDDNLSDDNNTPTENDNDNVTGEELSYHEMVDLIGRLHDGCKRNKTIGSKVSAFL